MFRKIIYVPNQRLGIFIDGYGLIGFEQGGFRKRHSTIDHVFVIKTLIDLYLNKRKGIYCYFIDYENAFDNVSRVSLQTKILKNGQILNVIKNLYSNAKCYVKMNGKLSNVFKSEIGVKQGDNSSPLFFSIYSSDLESFLSSKYGGLAYISELTENDDDLYE